MRGKQAEKGTVIVFFALMLPFLILFAGMAIDIGRSYLHKSYMQNAADMAALAGVETVSKKKASLITVTDVPALGQLITTESSKKADAGADKFLQMDNNGKWQTGGTNVKTELRKEIDPNKNSPLLRNRALEYYYKVELTDDMDFQFARLFLPEALIPADWTVKVEAWARGGNKDNPLAGINLNQMTSEVMDAYTFSTFQDMQAYYRGKSYEYVKEISFTNKGPAYRGDGSKSEIFDMDGTATINNSMNSLLVNYKPDFKSYKKLEDNWDIDKIASMEVSEAGNYLYNLLGLRLNNWRIIDENGVVVEENEGVKESGWEAFYRRMLAMFGEVKAKELMYGRITSIINVVQPYAVRNVIQLPTSEISYDVYTDEPNILDPLFVRIESEEYNTGSSGTSWVTNTVRDIFINIQADNTIKSNGEYIYRPMLFFYEGPVGENNERGVGRKSRTVNLTLDEDFRGILYAPNSPVYVKGNGHKFQGYIIAERFVDENGNTINTPENNYSEFNYSDLNPALAAEWQEFYTKLGLGEAKYDDFRAVRLNVYNNPNMDVAYTTSRAKETI